MRIKNDSQWDTLALRRIFQLTWRTIVHCGPNNVDVRDRRWTALTIRVHKGQKHCRWMWPQSTQPQMLHVTLPRLSGTEFIPLARQEHGGNQSRSAQHGGLLTKTAALCAQQFAYKLLGIGWAKNNLRYEVFLELKQKGFPEYVPVRIVRDAPAAQRDLLRERFDRATAAEARWRTKLKLAQTKLTKATKKRKHYARKLEEREVKP